MTEIKKEYRGYSITPHGQKFRVFLGKRIQFGSTQEAENAIDKHIEKQQCLEKAAVKFQRITIDEAFSKYLNFKKIQCNLREDSLRNYRQAMGWYRKDHPTLVYVDEMTGEVWDNWCVGELGECKHLTKWQLFVQIRGFAKWCEKRSYHVLLTD